MKFVYFVSFSHQYGFGNIEITQDFELTNMAYIKGIQKIIEDGGAIKPLVLNYHLLRKEDV